MATDEGRQVDAAPTSEPPVTRREGAGAAPPWLLALRRMLAAAGSSGAEEPTGRGATALRYCVTPQPRTDGALLLAVEKQVLRQGGAEAWVTLPQSEAYFQTAPNAAHRAALELLQSCNRLTQARGTTHIVLGPPLVSVVIPVLCRTGACWLYPEAGPPHVLAWDHGPAWEVHLVVRPEPDGGWALCGELRREGVRLDLAAATLVTRNLVVADGRAAELRAPEPFGWVRQLRERGRVRIPAGQEEVLLLQLHAAPSLPRLELPDPLRLDEVRFPAEPVLRIAAGAAEAYARRTAITRIEARVSFRYDQLSVDDGEPDRRLLDVPRRRALIRDTEAEQRALGQLPPLGLRRGDDIDSRGRAAWEIPAALLPGVVEALLEGGWRVESAGLPVRRGDVADLSVRTGADWLELVGAFEFGGVDAPARDVLAALRRGDRVVELGNGGLGVLPEDWLARYGMLAHLGDEPAAPGGACSSTSIGIPRAHAALVVAALEERPEIRVDRTFHTLREAFRARERLTPVRTPRGFRGELRPYQQEGLSWLLYLERHGLGGCLADDMGLGKTVQVLALLVARAARRGAGRPRRPSLVVAPRSLLFNWQSEAARFAPRLRVLEHVAADRPPPDDEFDDHDLILTTYGILRHDLDLLARRRFDYVILDEAQAIKNRASATAEAARTLKADHRLALSGTPIENHVGELWSLFEFLNPGLLGAAEALGMEGRARRTLDDMTRDALTRAIRPFLLRRTKAQVAPDLPDRTEETLLCELGREQRGFYERLRRHYQQTLLAEVRAEGLRKTRWQVLEALLRLRQAACHPALVDPELLDAEAVKIDVLVERVHALALEGHKALIFSQFTGMLSWVRARLDAEGLPYEYLDGSTANREERVARFQSDPACPLFLISLRAGGTGLNLTAADYVFLLDPWWNPAVEAQAIDRAHRIGQRRPVIAYRLICKDTIEEKIAALQETKRSLAASILEANEGILRTMTADDLEALLA